MRPILGFLPSRFAPLSAPRTADAGSLKLTLLTSGETGVARSAALISRPILLCMAASALVIISDILEMPLITMAAEIPGMMVVAMGQTSR